jgi:hypothetical protein
MKVQLIVEASIVESPGISEESINTITESIRANLNRFKEKYKTTRDIQLFSDCMTIVNVQIFKCDEN